MSGAIVGRRGSLVAAEHAVPHLAIQLGDRVRLVLRERVELARVVIDRLREPGEVEGNELRIGDAA